MTERDDGDLIWQLLKQQERNSILKAPVQKRQVPGLAR